MRRLPRKRLVRITRPGQYHEAHRASDIHPAKPARQLHQDISPHDPDEARARETAAQFAQRVDGEARAVSRLDPRGQDAAGTGDPSGAGKAVGEGCHAVCGFQRIAGRDHQPDLVQAQPPHRQQRDVPVTFMRRIEGSAQQADANGELVAKARNRIPIEAAGGQGRTCPEPVMT